HQLTDRPQAALLGDLVLEVAPRLVRAVPPVDLAPGLEAHLGGTPLEPQREAPRVELAAALELGAETLPQIADLARRDPPEPARFGLALLEPAEDHRAPEALGPVARRGTEPRVRLELHLAEPARDVVDGLERVEAREPRPERLGLESRVIGARRGL